MDKVKNILYFLIVLPILFTAGCLNNSSNTQTQNKELPDIVVYKGVGWPEKVYIEDNFNFPVVVEVNKEYLDGIICLASFNSVEWEIMGDTCKEIEYGQNNLYLPDKGIKLREGYMLTKSTERVMLDLCYNYTAIYSMEGCINRQRPCELKISIKQFERTPLYISDAFIKYDNNANSYILYIKFKVYTNRLGDNVILYITNKNIEEIKSKGCRLSSILSDNRISLGYELILPNGRVINGVLGNVGNFIEEFTEKINLRQLEEREMAYMEMKISYTVFERKDFGYITIVKR